MSLTTPFQMLGDPTAAACVGDVCEIPQTATRIGTQTATRIETQAATGIETQATTGIETQPATGATAETTQLFVNQQLDEDRV